MDAPSWARTPRKVNKLQARLSPDNAAGNSASSGPEKIRAELHAITLNKRNSEDGKPRVITNLIVESRRSEDRIFDLSSATMAPLQDIARKKEPQPAEFDHGLTNGPLA